MPDWNDLIGAVFGNGDGGSSESGGNGGKKRKREPTGNLTVHKLS